MQVSAIGMAQSINLNKKNTELPEIFTELGRQSGYQFFYNERLLEKASRVNVKITNGTLDEALKLCFKNQPFSYEILDKTVIIKEKKQSFIDKISDFFGQIKIAGRITDQKGSPIPGAVIREKGKTTATTTNERGEYQISVAENATLVVSFIGYKNQEIAVNGKTTINITLLEDSNELKEVNVVSTGYQTMDRKLFTGSSVKVLAKDAERSGVPDVSRMLEGQVAGVSVQNVSGTFGAAPKIRIRGATSLSGENKPLWVVDGIILEDVVNISNEALSTGDANTLIGSSVAGLNPDDIESFTILKDAAATALYGARAMNGVIVVTTKKGRNTEGQPSINYSSTFTTYLKPNYKQFDIMNSAEQMSVMLEMENKGYFNHSQISRSKTGGIFYKMYNQMYDYDPATDSYALKNTMQDRENFLQRYTSANTNWFDVLFKNSLLQEHSVSVNTGGARSQSYFSTSYTNDNGQTIGDKVKRYTVNFRNNFKVNDKLSFEFLANASIRDQQAPGTLTRASDAVYGSYSRDFDINPYSYSLNTSRLITPYDENGNPEFFVRNYAPFNIINELEKNYIKLNVLDIKVQGGVKYKIIPELTYSIDGAYRYAKTTRQHYIKEGSNMAETFRANADATIAEGNDFLYADPDNPNQLPVVVLPDGGFFNTTENGITNFYMRQNLEYNNTINSVHKLNFFGSVELRYTDRQATQFDGIGYQYENGGLVNPNYRYFKKMIEGGDPYFSMNYNYDRFFAGMFRGAYAYKNKYSVNATVRYDGSNLMGKSKVARWLPTWNISGAWDIDQESFFNTSNKILTSARVRATYGLVASLGNATNSAPVFYNQITRRPYENEKEAAIYLSSLANKNLTWEKLYELNLGTDLTFLQDRMNLTVDVYKRNIFDLIGNLRTSGIGGQYTKTANYGKMEAHGLEVTLGGVPITREKGFKWRTQVNFGLNKNKVTELEVNQNIWTLVRAEGAPLEGKSPRGLYSLQFAGLNPEYGFPTFIGANGKPSPYVELQSDDVEYLKYHGPVDPTFTGGYYNQFIYKNFTLSALITFAAGNYVRLQPTFADAYSDMDALSRDITDRWIMPGDEKYTNIPSILDQLTSTNFVINPNTGLAVNSRYPYNAYNYSTERVAKGDFIRLKNISVGYQFPKAMISKLGLNNLQLALVGNNIALLYSDKKLNGADPEFFNNGGVAMPIPKQYTLSLKVGF